MKARILISAMLLVVTACGTARVDGVRIRPESDSYGIVRNAATGKGIAGVPVTDGYSFTVTDSRGVYQMKRNPEALKIYYTLPEEYEVTLSGTGNPVFFSEGILKAGEKVRTDFTLTPSATVRKDYTVVAMGDPQCRDQKEAGRFEKETLKDFKETLTGMPEPVVIVLGDLGYDNYEMWEPMKKLIGGVTVDGRKVPFFPTIGNHDHDSTVEAEAGERGARMRYTREFGPVDYSFDRPGAHFVVMDNIDVKDGFNKSGNKNGRKWKYKELLTPQQLEWLREDLSLVRDKETKTLFICMHSALRAMSNPDDLLALMTGFRNAHLLTAHTHVGQTVVYGKYRCSSGNPVYEHITATACGSWWFTNCDVTGMPFGYKVFEMKGGAVDNWYSKGVGRDKGYRMRLYDGDQIYSGALGDKYSWADSKVTEKKKTMDAASGMGGCLIAEIFDGDSDNWNVELFIDGKKAGDLTKAPDGKAFNMCYLGYVYNSRQIKQKHKSPMANHFWYIRTDIRPSELSNFEVRATQTVPDSGRKNVYRCSRLTTDYSEF